jgi:ABC-type transport system substrate-binding protein
LSVNRQRLVSEVWLGFGVVARTPVHPALRWAQNPALDFTRRFAPDPTRARALLAEAGRVPRDGTPPLRLRLLHAGGRPELAAAAAILRDGWRPLGVGATVEAPDSPAALDAALARGDWDVLLDLSPPGADPDTAMAPVYFSAAAGGAGVSGYANATVDDLLSQGVRRLSRDERRKYYTHAQSLIADDLPALPLVDLAAIEAARDLLRGLAPSGTPWARWERVWRAEEAPARR